MNKPCEYCGCDLPLGVDKKTRRQRSNHFATCKCKARPVCEAEKKLEALAQQEPAGCACRWDAEGDRTVTCARHEGWLEVIAEWADRAREAEKKLKALAQQEPVLWVMPDGKIVDKWALQFYGGQVGKPRYTSPPAQRTWVGLTDDERRAVRNSVAYNQFMTAGEYAEHVQKATEAKLREKNNG